MKENLLNISTIRYYMKGRKYENKEEKAMKCFMCKGNMERKNVNYTVNLDDRVIIIKDVPAKVCTQCGEQYFDDETAENIEKIVNKLKELSIEVTIVNYKDKVA